jgi:hypothetical protein
MWIRTFINHEVYDPHSGSPRPPTWRLINTDLVSAFSIDDSRKVIGNIIGNPSHHTLVAFMSDPNTHFQICTGTYERCEAVLKRIESKMLMTIIDTGEEPK